MKLVLCLSFVFSFLLLAKTEKNYDEYGYVVYCPCMGRFGNQVDHLLGSLAFAKKLNRTLVVPPWISHQFNSQYKNAFIPYDKWFDLKALQAYHSVITMENFMKNFSSTLWPSEERKVYCHQAAMDRSPDKQSCPAKQGNPFGPFWNNFGIDFSSSIAYPSNLQYTSTKEQWDEAYPVEKNYVLAFMGAPASYPVNKNHRTIQKYIDWSDDIKNFASNFLSRNLERPYIGIHLRNGADWKRACDHISKDGINYAFMSSPQCTGYGKTGIKFTKEMCYPTKETLLEQTLKAVQDVSARTLFIATDSDSLKSDFNDKFREAGLSIKIVKLSEDALEKDLAILIEADHFVGNCGSSVTAFVVRKREALERSSSFFGLLKPSKSEL